jgi:ATP-dependent Clp protease ATP-binding subunit ClpA
VSAGEFQGDQVNMAMEKNHKTGAEESFNAESLAILKRAAEIAIRYRHVQIDHAHILLAFLEIPNRAIVVLSGRDDVETDQIEKWAQEYLRRLPRRASLNNEIRAITINPRVKVIIDMAQCESERQGAERVSPELLFFALATEDFYSELESGTLEIRLLSPMGLIPSQIKQILFDPPRDA